MNTISPNIEMDPSAKSCNANMEPDNVMLPGVMLPMITPVQPKKAKSAIPFWTEDPNVLLQPAHVLEFFPTESMSYNQKLNAVTRTVIVLTIISYVWTRNNRLLAVSAFTLLAIFLLYFSHKKTPALHTNELKEAFQNNSGITEPVVDTTFRGAGYFAKDPNVLKMGDQTKPPEMQRGFLPTEAPNPLGNVLLTDYEFHPRRPPAPPAFAGPVDADILAKTKQMIADENPGQPDIVNKLFGDLADELDFEQSMQPFYSTANTMIPNDQGGFMNFCYGDMISCKEGNMLACERNGPPRYQQ